MSRLTLSCFTYVQVDTVLLFLCPGWHCPVPLMPMLALSCYKYVSASAILLQVCPSWHYTVLLQVVSTEWHCPDTSMSRLSLSCYKIYPGWRCRVTAMPIPALFCYSYVLAYAVLLQLCPGWRCPVTAMSWHGRKLVPKLKVETQNVGCHLCMFVYLLLL